MTYSTVIVIALIHFVSFCEGFNLKIVMDRLDSIESRLEIRRQEMAIVYEKISVIDVLEAKVKLLTEGNGKEAQSIGVENKDIHKTRDKSVDTGDLKNVLFKAFRREKIRNKIMYKDYKQFKDEVMMSLDNQTQTFNAQLGQLSESINEMNSSLNYVEAAIKNFEIQVNKTTNIGQHHINAINEKVEKVTEDINMMNSTLIDVKDSTKNVEIQVNKTTNIGQQHINAVNEKLEKVTKNIYVMNSTLIDVKNSTKNIEIQVNKNTGIVSNCLENITFLQADFESKVKQLQTNNELLSKKQDLLRQTAYIGDSCTSLKLSGLSNGVIQLRTSNLKTNVQVYCDQETDGGGWIVFQRRKDGSVGFNRNWNDYKLGFGDLNGEFWLGNEYLSGLTSDGTYELRIDMEDFNGNKFYAKYNRFKIYPEWSNYRLEAGGYSGDVGDSLEYHYNMPFSTNDNYHAEIDECKMYNSGWWFNNCFMANLNGVYYQRKGPPRLRGINWNHWLGYSFTLKFTEMKFRKK